MKLGKAALEALQAEITGRLEPGDELIVVGAIALSGTVTIAEKKEEKLSEIFSYGFLQSARNVKNEYGTGEIARESEVWSMAESSGASAIYALNEGGFLSGLWKMAEASGVGLHVDLRKVPIRQETIELSEIFDINPYKLESHGAILMGMKSGEAFASELRRMGYMAEIIGQANKENDRLLFSGENVRYLERPAKDEVYKLKDM